MRLIQFISWLEKVKEVESRLKIRWYREFQTADPRVEIRCPSDCAIGSNTEISVKSNTT
jgi:hypothetical protein